jgi:hypothetical protein
MTKPLQEATKPPPCKLCGEPAKLRGSHILPAFVFRWLKETSATGHFRFGGNPNRRVQDGWKEQWLCDTCENDRLGRNETAFATRLFYPSIENTNVRVSYQHWLLKFCTSLSWRVLRLLRDMPDALRHLNSTQTALADMALHRWAEFLLDRVPHPGIFEQHLIRCGDDFLASIIRSHSELPVNLSRYMHRAVEMDVVTIGEKSGYSYAKIGPIIVFGLVGRPEGEWRGAKVHVKDGLIKPSVITLPIEVLEHIKNRAVRHREIYESISENQLDKIEQAFQNDIERARRSLTVKAMLQDEQLFGTEAIFRKPKEAL